MDEAQLRARFPLTLRYLGDAFLADDIVARVNAAHAGGTIADRAARDIVRYEAELARVAARPALRPTSDPLPADDVALVLAPDASLLMYGADLPTMLDALREGKPATPRPRRAWMLLVPKGNGEVKVTAMGRDDGWLLEWFHEPTTIAEVLGMIEERAPIETLWRRGLVVKA